MVDFIVLLVGCIVSLLRGTVLSNNITVNDTDGGAIINVTIALGKDRNFKFEDWLKVVTQVSELSQAIGNLGTARDKGPRLLMYAAAPPLLMSPKCDRCWRLVDPSQGGRCKGIGYPWASSTPSVLVRG